MWQNEVNSTHSQNWIMTKCLFEIFWTEFQPNGSLMSSHWVELDCLADNKSLPRLWCIRSTGLSAPGCFLQPPYKQTSGLIERCGGSWPDVCQRSQRMLLFPSTALLSDARQPTLSTSNPRTGETGGGWVGVRGRRKRRERTTADKRTQSKWVNRRDAPDVVCMLSYAYADTSVCVCVCCFVYEKSTTLSEGSMRLSWKWFDGTEVHGDYSTCQWA